MNVSMKHKKTHRNGEKTCGYETGRWKGKEWEFGISRGKLVYIGWINNNVLLCSTENYIQYPVINHNRKEYENYVCVCVCVRMCVCTSQVALVVKCPPANAGDVRDTVSIPASGRSPGGGHGNPLQYSCLENPMDRVAWQAKSMGSQRVGHN